jgi:DNA-binding response OmpR family regulator
MRNQYPSALLVSPDPDDRLVLTRIFDQENWALSTVRGLKPALAFLRRNPVPLVISECRFASGGWKDLLAATRDLPQSPSLVVMCRQADERLWSEVLNLGGHDVLSKPLSHAEVLWVSRHVFAKCAFPRTSAALQHATACP